MAVKAKKRKLTTPTATKERDGTAPTVNRNTAEVELQRQEEEMFAATRLLKQVDKEDALTVAKKILESNNGVLTTTLLVKTEELVQEFQTDTSGSVNEAASNGYGPRNSMGQEALDQGDANEPRQLGRARPHRKSVATKVTPSALSEQAPATRETRSKPITSSIQSATSRSTIAANGEQSALQGNIALRDKDRESWLADLTVANIQKQNDAHEQEEQRQHQINVANSAATHPSTPNGTGSRRSTPANLQHPHVLTLRSSLRRGAMSGIVPGCTAFEDGETRQQGEARRAARGERPKSVVSDTSTSYVASIVSEPALSLNHNTTPTISVTLRPVEELESNSSSISGYDIPVAALVQPRLTKSLIQQKARSTYAPATAAVPEPRRRPGRPPGYFLGPTSCAYCRTQHRRCDFNTVCSRCIKAKIPCDRSGTVDRPTIIVREARQQAKAEAAAALAAAVAAGLATVPEKPRLTQRYTQLDALTREAASITARIPTPTPSESTSTSAGVKRRRSPSPSDVTRGNIIERKHKRVAAVTPIQKFDPSVYSSRQGSSRGQSRRSCASRGTGQSGTAEDLSDTELTSAGSPSRSASQADSSELKRGAAARKATKEPMAKRLAASPSSSSKRAKYSPLAKLERGKGKTSKSQPSTLVVPSKRSRGLEKAVSYTKGFRDKQIAEDSTDDEASTLGKDESSTQPAVRLVKKAYLKSGLYSADLKVNPINNSKLTVTLKHASKQSHTLKTVVPQNKRGTRTSSSSRSGPFFQLPINYGSVLMSKQKDFCLPFDIMQSWKAGILRKTIQPEPFIKIRSNIFVERKRRTETSPMVCHCTPPPPGSGRVGCGEDCYNRVMFYECISAHCPCGDQCSNQRFQKRHKEDHLCVIWTQERGFGIQTLAPIKKGSLVIEYRGEVISQNECHRRMETIYKNNKNFYFLEYEKGEVVDACQKGTNARFVNHSCSPNSQIEKWFLNGEMSIGIFASQDIPVGAEISYDYNFSSFSGAQKQKCRCGAPNCRGYIGERISKSKETLVPVPQPPSGRTGKKVDGRKRKAGRRKVNDQESNSLRMTQMPSVRQIRQRQSDKYKEGKMAAIRYTKLFLFRNIRLVESKYIKYAQTKSRSYQETVSRSWLQNARQCRKRRLESVIDDLRAVVQDNEKKELRVIQDQSSSDGSVAGDDGSGPSLSVATEDGLVVLEIDVEEDEDEDDAIIGYEDEEEEEVQGVDVVADDLDQGDRSSDRDELQNDTEGSQLQRVAVATEEEEIDELESESDS